MAGIEIKTSERWERDIVNGKIVGTRRISVVELWVSGVRLTTDVANDFAGRDLVLMLAKNLDIGRGHE